MKKYMNRASMTCGTNFKKHNIHVSRVLNQGWGYRKNILEKNNSLIFPNLMKIINPQI